jgi:hypothetical protein
MAKRILILSDVTLGFSVPQIHLLARSLAASLDAETLIVEPDMKGRRDFTAIEGVRILRISTRMPPHDSVFVVEYARAVRQVYREFAPDILVVLNAGLLPPLLLEAHRPTVVVYYMLESLDHQMVHGGALSYDLNRMAANLIDLVLVPERRRFDFDKTRLRWPDIPTVEVLNVSPDPGPVESARSGCRFLYAGTLSRESGMDFLLDERLKELDIDVVGPIDSVEAREFVERFTAPSEGGRKRYLGLVPHSQVLKMLPSYSYRIVVWKAETLNSYFASPNKFFESIAYGVPPVCTPNPQILDIARKYHCALVAKDWGLDSFCHVMADASWISGTSTYDQLVANCALARQAEINWAVQFDKVRVAIEDVLARRSPAPAPATASTRQSRRRAAAK